MPVMPLVEVKGSIGVVAPLHIGAMALKIGVVSGVTVTVSEVLLAHWPMLGVKVYVPVAVLLTVAGDHVPAIPLVEVARSVGAVAPLHIGAIALKVGVVSGVTVTVSVVLVAHCPEFGVNV